MLLRVKIKNFLSFENETIFDMFPNTKRERFANHIYNVGEIPLLRCSAIYGANGSGKSNFIKAIAFIRNFITDKDFLKNKDLNSYRFLLKQDNTEPISLEIEFKDKKQYYIYQVIISTKIIERLYSSGLGTKEDTLIFERNDSKITTSIEMTNAESSFELLRINPKSSILALNKEFPVINDNQIKDVYKWFDKKIDIVTINATLPILIDLMSNHKELFEFTNDLLKKIGVGVDSININNTPFEEWISDEKNANEIMNQNLSERINTSGIVAQLQSGRNIRSFSTKNGSKVVQEFIFNHLGKNGYIHPMNISSQSDGTVRLLTLIPAVYYAMHSNKVVIIDEIENSIHPKLVYELLKYFSENKSDGQLIFTTHTTKLLDQQNLMRLDEIWITEKTLGNTTMRSLNDFKIHNTINIENGYLDGRYGGIPELQINDYDQ